MQKMLEGVTDNDIVWENQRRGADLFVQAQYGVCFEGNTTCKKQRPSRYRISSTYFDSLARRLSKQGLSV